MSACQNPRQSQQSSRSRHTTLQPQAPQASRSSQSQRMGLPPGFPGPVPASAMRRPNSQAVPPWQEPPPTARQSAARPATVRSSAAHAQAFPPNMMPAPSVARPATIHPSAGRSSAARAQGVPRPMMAAPAPVRLSAAGHSRSRSSAAHPSASHPSNAHPANALVGPMRSGSNRPGTARPASVYSQGYSRQMEPPAGPGGYTVVHRSETVYVSHGNGLTMRRANGYFYRGY